MTDRKRSRFIVEIDLDPVPGWGNEPADHAEFLRRHLQDAVGHYNPTVEDVTDHNNCQVTTAACRDR